jgi:hypothetical protein
MKDKQLENYMDDLIEGHKLDCNDLASVKAEIEEGLILPSLILKQSKNVDYLFNISFKQKNTLHDMDILSKIKERELKSLISMLQFKEEIKKNV